MALGKKFPTGALAGQLNLFQPGRVPVPSLGGRRPFPRRQRPGFPGPALSLTLGWKKYRARSSGRRCRPATATWTVEAGPPMPGLRNPRLTVRGRKPATARSKGGNRKVEAETLGGVFLPRFHPRGPEKTEGGEIGVGGGGRGPIHIPGGNLSERGTRLLFGNPYFPGRIRVRPAFPGPAGGPQVWGAPHVERRGSSQPAGHKGVPFLTPFFSAAGWGKTSSG